MTDDEEQRLRAMMVEVIGASAKAIEKSLRDQLLELQADVALCLDRFDTLEVDMRDAKKELERLADKTAGLVVDMRDVKAHTAKMSREHIKDRVVVERLASMEKRLLELEKVGGV
jgi:hypothetical protein